MRIAIDASALTKKHKTGIEVYAESVITELLKQDRDNEILLYAKEELPEELLSLHPHARTRLIRWPRLWSLGGLSQAVWQDKPDALFVPAGILPPIHPRRSVVVVHGLEYEFFPESYSIFQFWHLAIFTRRSAHRAQMVVTPSEQTKYDLSTGYHVAADRIVVAYPGVPEQSEEGDVSEAVSQVAEGEFLFWLGRKERRKNVETVIRTFERLKERGWEGISLVLAGQPGEGYKNIRRLIANSSVRNSIYEFDHISDAERSLLYKKARCFVFPSFYEGFGLPILEAQTHGVPVVTSNAASLPEAGGDACLYADPDDVEKWVTQVELLFNNSELREELVQRGTENLDRFSFAETARTIHEQLVGEKE